MKHQTCTPQDYRGKKKKKKKDCRGHQNQGKSQAFPGGLVVRTLCYPPKPRFNPGQRTEIHKPHSEAKTKPGNSEKLSWPRGS